MDKVKNIVECGLFQGWSRDNIIMQIMFEIATKEEIEWLGGLWCDMEDLPQLEEKAENLYNEYREKYYNK